MPIPFTCPHCGAHTQVAEHYAGQTGPCSSCGQKVTVPSPGGPLPAKPKSSSGMPLVLTIVLVACFALLVCSGGLVALLLPAVQAAREATRRMTCSNNLKQIGLAMHNYHDVYGSLPPAYLADENGRPMHSWRVLLLPFLEQAPLFDQYDFSQPWDSPKNQWLADLSIPTYRCPSDGEVPPHGTNYMVITGPGTLFENDDSSRFSDVTDGTSLTIMVVEVRGTSVPWTAPQDLDFRQLGAGINGAAGINAADGGPGSWHPGGAMVLLADGSVRYLPEGISPQDLKALATRAGGEQVFLP